MLVWCRRDPLEGSFDFLHIMLDGEGAYANINFIDPIFAASLLGLGPVRGGGGLVAGSRGDP